MDDFFQEFLSGLQKTSLLEYVAVTAGTISVWFSKKENIWVYPTGLINTIIYIYLSFKYHLIGEGSVNFYYTIMSIYGWYLWIRKDVRQKPILRITASSKNELTHQLLFFICFYVLIFFSINFLQRYFEGAIPWADAFASATAYTGMWLMARKKIESWWWWIATNIASIPLYYTKGLVFTSVYYFILLVLAVFGLFEWKRRGKAVQNAATFAVQHDEKSGHHRS